MVMGERGLRVLARRRERAGEGSDEDGVTAVEEAAMCWGRIEITIVQRGT